jgi:fatty acid desaturase
MSRPGRIARSVALITISLILGLMAFSLSDGWERPWLFPAVFFGFFAFVLIFSFIRTVVEKKD